MRLIRVFEGEASELLDISADGQYLLARGTRTGKCGNRAANKCGKPVLAVYSTVTGKTVLETVGGQGGWFVSAAFTQRGVEVIEVGANQPPTRVVLSLSPPREKRERLILPAEFQSQCMLSNGDVLGVMPSSEGRRLALAVAHGQGVHRPPQPPLFINHDLNCATWILGSFILMPARTPELHWISTGSEPSDWCSDLPKRLYNHAISPDGSLIVAISGTSDPGGFDKDVMGPDHSTGMHVLAAPGCAQLRTVQLHFPEQPKLKAPLLAPKNKYWANARLVSVFARTLAISPNNTKVAIGYGVRTDGIYSDAIAYFGIYSLQDGRRLATLRGDVFKNGLWESIKMFDTVPTNWAPVTGTVRFSYDGKTLFCSSEKLRQWDLSRLE